MYIVQCTVYTHIVHGEKLKRNDDNQNVKWSERQIEKAPGTEWCRTKNINGSVDAACVI